MGRLPPVDLRELLPDEPEEELSHGIEALPAEAAVTSEGDTHFEGPGAVGALGASY